MRVSSAVSLFSSSFDSDNGDLGVRVGFQLVSASSMAWDVLSTSVRRTVALLI